MWSTTQGEQVKEHNKQLQIVPVSNKVNKTGTQTQEPSPSGLANTSHSSHWFFFLIIKVRVPNILTLQPALALTPYPNSRFLLVSSSCFLSSSLTLQKTSSLIHDNIWCVRTGMTGCILGVFMTPQRGYLPRVWGRGMPSRPLFPLILSLNTPLWITSAPPATHPPQHVHRLL